MEIVTWKDKTWTDIQQQDNPAFDYTEKDGKPRRNQCLLVMKVLPYEETAVGKDGYVVIEVPIYGDVIRRGLFWHYEHAEMFAGALAGFKIS